MAELTIIDWRPDERAFQGALASLVEGTFEPYTELELPVRLCVGGVDLFVRPPGTEVVMLSGEDGVSAPESRRTEAEVYQRVPAVQFALELRAAIAEAVARGSATAAMSHGDDLVVRAGRDELSISRKLGSSIGSAHRDRVEAAMTAFTDSLLAAVAERDRSGHAIETLRQLVAE